MALRRRAAARVASDPSRPLSDSVRVAHRYVRSVDIARDLADVRALDGYVVTTSVRDAARRILAGLDRGSTHRAFRIVGPYGCGKSAFGLMLARLMLERVAPRAVGGPATTLAGAEGSPAPDDMPVYVPIVVVGRRASLQDALLDSLAAAASGGTPGRRCTVVARAAAALAADRRAGKRDDGAILSLLDTYARDGAGRGRWGGVLVVVDEMGRFLEHSSLDRHADDPTFVQRLAERAGGASDAPVGVVALLHHRFADYAAGLGKWAEAEWARSAQRYEEIVFHGSAEQTLFLLAQAVEVEAAVAGQVADKARDLYADASRRGVFATAAHELDVLAPRLFPLHPATIASLARLASRFGQHERSVFGFLQSFEPHGFQRFVQEATLASGRWYAMPELFDYLSHQARDRLGSTDQERRWTLANDAVSQACDLPDQDLAALKCVALLAILEPVPGLRPDIDTVAWAVGATPEEIEASLERLRARKLLYRRPHRDDFGLWSSTSVDLEAWLDEARVLVPVPTRFDAEVLRASRPRPLVAHRHYHRTGTLRAFDVLPWDAEGAIPTTSAGEADGALVVVPVYPEETMDGVLKRHAAAFAGAPTLTLFCLRRIAASDLKLAHELALWQWVAANCMELRVDDIARREVRERLAASEAALAVVLKPIDAARAGRDETWVHAGEVFPLESRAALSAKLSDACDAVFDQAPVLRNELVNRAKLSSAAASARMRLLELMVQDGDRPRLGLAGAPPEKAIYLSVLEASGLHHDLGDGRFGFAAPRPDPRNWTPAWLHIESLLEGNASCGLVDLLASLARPPIGLRSGPALILVAAVMLHHRRDVALIERNTFQPEVTGAHLMRLAKNPGHFALRHLGRGAGRSAVLEQLAMFGTPWDEGPRPEPAVKPLVEALYGWWGRLPQFALETSRISAAAQAVRLALRKGREPIELLFEDLPRALGVVPGPTGAIHAETFVEALNAALLEIGDAARTVRSQAVAAVLDAFGTGTLAELRAQVELDYGPHRLRLGDQRMRSFVERAIVKGVDDAKWLDGIAGLLCGRRLDAWQDATVDEFGFEVRAIAQRLARWLATMRAGSFGAAPVVGLHVTCTNGRERSVMVRTGSLGAAAAARLAQLRTALGDGPEADEALTHLIAERMATKEAVDG